MEKKLVIVTGGTKGIGKAILQAFSDNPAFDLATCARSQSDLDDLKKELEEKGVTVFIQQADLSKKEGCQAFIEYVKSLNRRIEILVNNSGIFFPGSVHEEEEDVMEKTMETNLYSAYYITRGFIQGMKSRKRGHIFNICSTASIIPYVNGGSYCMSKFALYGMTKVLREEMKEHGVKVTAVLPGATLTASWEGVDLPPDRFMKPKDVASAIVNAYQMSENSVVEEILIRPQLGDI